MRGEREWGGSSSSSSSGWIGESVWGGTHTLSRWGYPLTGARRQGPWRLAPLPRQQVNGQAGSAGQGPDARIRGVCFATQTPGMLASPKKVKNEFFFKRGQIEILLAREVITVILSVQGEVQRAVSRRRGGRTPACYSGSCSRT